LAALGCGRSVQPPAVLNAKANLLHRVSRRGGFVDRNRGGRPRIDPGDDSVPVHVVLPARQYDAAYRRAQADRISVPEVIRRALHRSTQIGRPVLGRTDAKRPKP
jgi:hypothetical protein